MKRFAYALVGTALVAGCHTETPRAHVGMRLTTAAAAKKYSLRSRHVELPFFLAEQGVNGTALMFDFLQKLESTNALYAAELSYAIQVRLGATPIECVSKVSLVTNAPPPAKPAPSEDSSEYSTTVKPFRPDATDTWVTDRELACKQHATQVVTRADRYDTSYDVQVGGHLEWMPKDYKSEIQYYEACDFAQKRKYVHRYEHFVAARFNPPNLTMVGHRYADVELVEEPPVCHEIVVKPGEPLHHHMTADAFYGPDVEIKPVENPIVYDPILGCRDGHCSYN